MLVVKKKKKKKKKKKNVSRLTKVISRNRSFNNLEDHVRNHGKYYYLQLHRFLETSSRIKTNKKQAKKDTK